MKCQRNASPYAACFASQVLRAVLADDLDAGLGQRRQVFERDVLRRGDDGDARPDLLANALVALADLIRRRRRSLPAGRSRPRRAGARRTSPGSHAVQRSKRSTRSTPAARSARSALVQRSRRRSRTTSSPNALAERRRHLLPHLVAARADRRADRGRSSTCRLAERRGCRRRFQPRLHARCDDALEQPAPAGVEDGDGGLARAGARERDRQAVGGEREDRQAGLVGPEPVARARRASPAPRATTRAECTW